MSFVIEISNKLMCSCMGYSGLSWVYMVNYCVKSHAVALIRVLKLQMNPHDIFAPSHAEKRHTRHMMLGPLLLRTRLRRRGLRTRRRRARKAWCIAHCKCSKLLWFMWESELVFVAIEKLVDEVKWRLSSGGLVVYLQDVANGGNQQEEQVSGLLGYEHLVGEDGS